MLDLATGDSLEVFDGDSVTATRLALFTGDEGTLFTMSTGNKVLLRLKATGSKVAKGFSVKYQVGE